MSSENKKIQNIIFDYGDKIDFLKQKIKDLTKNQNTLKSNFPLSFITHIPNQYLLQLTII